MGHYKILSPQMYSLALVATFSHEIILNANTLWGVWHRCRLAMTPTWLCLHHDKQISVNELSMLRIVWQHSSNAVALMRPSIHSARKWFISPQYSMLPVGWTIVRVTEKYVTLDIFHAG